MTQDDILLVLAFGNGAFLIWLALYVGHTRRQRIRDGLRYLDKLEEELLPPSTSKATTR